VVFVLEESRVLSSSLIAGTLLLSSSFLDNNEDTRILQFGCFCLTRSTISRVSVIVFFPGCSISLVPQ
jgi:hypothetical protein